MTHPVPSREALRALTRLCRNDGFIPCRHISNLGSRKHMKPSIRIYSPSPTYQPKSRLLVRQKTTLTDASETQTFKNGPSRYDPQTRTGADPDPEPSAQGTSDPQNDTSGPGLPDITNYYTLFPRTIPHGPPGPQPRIPDSSNTTNGDHSAPTRFQINTRELRKEFLQLQSVYHPDKYAAGSVAHQRAYALSTLLNNAYKTLCDPLLRAQYLLQMQYEIDVTNEDNSAHPSDPETLMVVMEAQEELEDATSDGGQGIVNRLVEENKARIRDTEKTLGAAFEKGDVGTARDESVKLNYWRSLESGLREWEPGKEVRLTH